MPVTPQQQAAARRRAIQRITGNVGAEANAYSAIRDLLVRVDCGITLEDDCVVVDTPIRGHGRPDVAIWRAGVSTHLRVGSEHLYAVLEGKPGSLLERQGDRLAVEKHTKYRTAHLRVFFLYDSEQVWQYDPDSQLTNDLARR